MRDEHLLKDFTIVLMLSNPIRYKARERLYRECLARLKAEAPGVRIVTVEVALGDRGHVVTDRGHPDHIQLHTIDEMWHKENAINIAVSRLPFDWKYLAWIDADIEFLRKDWAIETVHALQHYHVVQMWQHAVNLGPGLEVTNGKVAQGFAYCYLNNIPTAKYDGRGNISYGTFWHPGFAWAMTREAWDHLGGLLDICILGAADYHMAYALIGRARETLDWSMSKGRGYHPNYKNMILAWQHHAETYVKRDIGYVPGTILHHWHGKHKDRKYNERWLTLVNNQFDPMVDIKRDAQGLWQLCTTKWKFRDELRAYARARNEDSIDT